MQDKFETLKKMLCLLYTAHRIDSTLDREKLNDGKKKTYRLGARNLLFLMKHLYPDALNAVRELSKWMSDGATVYHKKVMLQIMNYILCTSDQGLHLNLIIGIASARKEKFIMKEQCDSNRSTNAEMKKSASSIKVTLNRVLVVTQNAEKKAVLLSVTEAELTALA